MPTALSQWMARRGSVSAAVSAAEQVGRDVRTHTRQKLEAERREGCVSVEQLLKPTLRRPREVPRGGRPGVRRAGFAASVGPLGAGFARSEAAAAAVVLW